MDEAVSGSVRKRLFSAFPDGTFTWADVLGYGDDPAVESGDTAVRAFIDLAGMPEENRDSRQALDDFARVNSEGIGKLRDGLLPSIAWVEFVADSSGQQAEPRTPGWGSTRLKCKRSM